MNYFGIAESVAYKLVAGLSNIAILEKELDLIDQHKIKLITIADVAYPSLLKEIHSPPTVLYYASAVALAKEDQVLSKCLAIVGARKANEYGARAVDAIVPDLVGAGYTIVSGGALGLDAMAHEAALKCGGKTIAILGSGLLRLYPSSNKNLFKRIIENGGIVASPYPLMMEGLPHNFPARNRIVTGLSQGCLVVQAAKKSGALISAHCALDQGREVFAVPGHFDDELSAGCHEIIQQGAKLVMSSADILSEFGEKIPVRTIEEKSLQQTISFTSARPEPTKDFAEIYSEPQQKIIAACKNAISLEDIMAVANLSFEQVQSELFTLQLDGVVSQDFTGMWSLQ
jgi:DNA processing protein